jgi:DICT domain-containing protein
MKFTSPKANEKFTISSMPEWPSIAFETDGSGTHEWHWSIIWDNFAKSGVVRTPSNKWDAKDVITNCGAY